MEASSSFLGSTKPNISLFIPSSSVLHRRDFSLPALKLKKVSVLPLILSQKRLIRAQCSDGLRPNEDDGFVLEDVPHLTKFLPDLPVFDSSLFLSRSLSTSVMKIYKCNMMI